jgi:hypothetical protein
MDINLAEIYWKLEMIPPEKLPEIATDLLILGIESHSLCVLAGLSASKVYEAADLFNQALVELGRPAFTKREAMLKYTKIMSNRIVQGEISAYEGANSIWKATLKLDFIMHELDAFIYAASEYEDRPESRDLFNSEIIKEALRWIS